MADTIYVEGRYLEGKLLCERFIIKQKGINPFGDQIREYADILDLVKKIKNANFAYQNLGAEEIEASKCGVMLRRPLTPRELEWIALNATKQDKV